MKCCSLNTYLELAEPDNDHVVNEEAGGIRTWEAEVKKVCGLANLPIVN